jgi:hypothetical protein
MQDTGCKMQDRNGSGPGYQVPGTWYPCPIPASQSLTKPYLAYPHVRVFRGQVLGTGFQVPGYLGPGTRYRIHAEDRMPSTEDRANPPAGPFDLDPNGLYTFYEPSPFAEVAEWQTRWTQDPMGATPWGFKSPLPHQ